MDCGEMMISETILQQPGTKLKQQPQQTLRAVRKTGVLQVGLLTEGLIEQEPVRVNS